MLRIKKGVVVECSVCGCGSRPNEDEIFKDRVELKGWYKKDGKIYCGDKHEKPRDMKWFTKEKL